MSALSGLDRTGSSHPMRFRPNGRLTVSSWSEILLSGKTPCSDILCVSCVPYPLVCDQVVAAHDTTDRQLNPERLCGN